MVIEALRKSPALRTMINFVHIIQPPLCVIYKPLRFPEYQEVTMVFPRVLLPSLVRADKPILGNQYKYIERIKANLISIVYDFYMA